MSTDSASDANRISDDADIDHFANHLPCTTCTGDTACDYAHGLRDAYAWMATGTDEMHRDAHKLVKHRNDDLSDDYLGDYDWQPVYLGSLRGGTTIDLCTDYGSGFLMAVLV
ncbi:MAG TPA: hypothetical protein VJT72_05920 [Pseudonocardiaceae bacterium]|nr:hypothetical protein [Pseudonocardiaceae bacterium]